MDPAVTFGKVLRSMRREAGLTQEQLTLSANVERNFVSLMERGINQPTIRVMFKLARALDVLPSSIIRRVEQSLDESATPKL